MKTREIEKTISVVQNGGLAFATTRDEEIVRYCCDHIALDIDSGDPVFLEAKTKACQCDFSEEDVDVFQRLFHSWTAMESFLKTQPKEILDRFACFLNYLFGACQTAEAT